MSRAAPSPLQERLRRIAESRLPVTAWVVVVAAATAALVCAMVPVGPDWLGTAGAVAVASSFTWALAARTGGRPVIFGFVALAFALGVVLAGHDLLRTGAAVLTASIAAVLGVMVTVPAQRFLQAVRESVVAVLVAAVGALGAVGFEPTIRVVRFEYVTLGLALVGAFLLVYRLGAGLHGLGRRGLVVVGVGSIVLLLILLYAETLHRYGAAGFIDTLDSWVTWSRDELGAFPRPIMAVLGIPAIVYGGHMRARRRQGWWVCMFGVAATTRVTTALTDPTVALREIGLSVLYALVIGWLIGWLLIRLDLALSGNRGRRRRVEEQAAAHRPEPARTKPLL